MAARRPFGWIPVVIAVAGTAGLAAVVAWRLQLTTLERGVKERRSALKKLVLSGGIPPTEEVMAYLTQRDAALHAAYDDGLKATIMIPPVEAETANPQLYFQEQLHKLQRTLEQLASARGVSVPEALGFPKDLPPSDTVPRFLVQVSLMQEMAEVIFEQGVSTLASLKVEDPETVPELGGQASFLMRLPVRVRLTCSTRELMKVLGAVHHMTPLVDLRVVQVTQGSTADVIDAELLVSRYLVVTRPS